MQRGGDRAGSRISASIEEEKARDGSTQIEQTN
jgi:hypothetical protein